MSHRIDYTMSRDSVGGAVNRRDPYLVKNNQTVWERGVRGGYGAVIMPAVTQLFYDNYFSNQTVDSALATPWTGVTSAIVRDENALIGDFSVELPDDDSRIYDTFTLAAATHTLSFYAYVPPPAMIDEVFPHFDNANKTPTGIVSLGGYWYFIWYSGAAVASAKNYGVWNENTSEGSVWIDCLSLTQTDAPVGFVPNSSTTQTYASADHNLKFTLPEPLPASGSLSFTVMPFFTNTNKAVDDDPVILSFFPNGGDTSSDDYLIIQIDDNGSQGIYAVKKVGGGAAESTGTTGYAKTGFAGFTPIEIVLTWSFEPSGTKHVNIFANGELAIESADWDEGFPVNLTDLWIGSQRDTGPANSNHAQSLIQDVTIHSRES